MSGGICLEGFCLGGFCQGVFVLEPVSKGIMFVSNLVDRKGELKNWETVSQEFNLNPVHFSKEFSSLFQAAGKKL